MKEVFLNKAKWELIKGWGETHKVNSLVFTAFNVHDCKKCIDYAKKNRLTIISTGSKYTFGDMILNSNNISLSISKMDKIINWNSESGIIVTEPGVMVADVLLKAAPDNWNLGSIPGGLEVTLAGAISNNIHGKDSWKVGNFGERVVSMKILLENKEIISVTRENELFEAVIGGLGLIGIIIEITLQLTKIVSPYVEPVIASTKNLSETLAVLDSKRYDSDFAIAWLDCFAKGNSLGRGYVSSSKWHEGTITLNENELKNSLRMSKKIFDIFPAKLTWFLLRPFNQAFYFRILNVLIYYSNKIAHKRQKKLQIQLFTKYNFMHNRIPCFNHFFRPKGFVEIQFLFPKNIAYNAILECLNICHREKQVPTVCAIKMHKKDDYMISFSEDGYSFNVDIALKSIKKVDLETFVAELYNLAEKYKAKIHLAKDELLPKSVFKKIYPRYQDFLNIKKKYDPTFLFSSDLFKRLF